MGSTEEQHGLQVPTLPPKEAELPPTEFQVKPKEIIKLVKNDGSKEVYKIIKKTGETMLELSDIAVKSKCDIGPIVFAWNQIPDGNPDENTEGSEGFGGSDNLAKSGEAIIAVSDAVDQAVDKKYPDIPDNEKTALKLNIMGDLLKLKARLLEGNN